MFICDFGVKSADQSCLQTVKVHIKARQITVEGPRGKLVKDLSHIAVTFTKPKPGVIAIHIHHGVRKNVAALRTVRTIVNNLVIGVTKGFKYKMRYVYAHFPINVNLDKNPEGVFEVEIRYVLSEQSGPGLSIRMESDLGQYLGGIHWCREADIS